MVVRIKLTLLQEEYSALLKWALAEERNPEGQLRFILRKELGQRGLIQLTSSLPPGTDCVYAGLRSEVDRHYQD